MAIAKITVTMTFDTSKLPEPPEGYEMPAAEEILEAVKKEVTPEKIAKILGAHWGEYPGFATCDVDGEIIP